MQESQEDYYFLFIFVYIFGYQTMFQSFQSF